MDMDEALDLYAQKRTINVEEVRYILIGHT